MPSIRNAIKQQALSLGFDAVGFALPTSIGHAKHDLQDYLSRGYHGEMSWMETNADKRGDPHTLWPEANTAIVVGHNYAPEQNPLDKLHDKKTGNISCYAQNKDYHDVMKKKLRVLARWLAETHDCDVKLFVDTAPIMEKPLAEAAGIGWQGKHTCLVSREFGSWLFIGSVFTTLKLQDEKEAQPEDSSEGNRPFHHCGNCTSCLDICPTQAFTGPGQLDSRRCIAYLTNEHKEQIPLEFRKAIGNRIYGCDDCLAICPWNKFAQTTKETSYHAKESLKSPPLKELLTLDDAAFRTYFSGSPIKRIGRNRFIRNVLVAAGNSEEPSLTPLIEPLRNDDSPIVSEMAHWALGELQKSP